MSSRAPVLLRAGTVGRPPQRWARWASWIAFACPIPSMLWRSAMLLGVDTGYAEAQEFRASPALTGYVLGLNLAELAAAVACLGLCQRWGEVVPDWVPVIGGRVIPRLLPTVLGSLGAAALLTVFGPLLVSFLATWSGTADN